VSSQSADLPDFWPHVLSEYALVADGERGALIGPHGELTWMCAPQWHSDAVFSALIGARAPISEPVP
jgi:alpha,alpha-trehalase